MHFLTQIIKKTTYKFNLLYDLFLFLFFLVVTSLVISQSLIVDSNASTTNGSLLVNDFYQDEKVNTIDYSVLLYNLNTSNPSLDLDGSELVDEEDIPLSFISWGKKEEDIALQLEGESAFLPPPPGTTDEQIIQENLYAIEPTEENRQKYSEVKTQSTIERSVPGHEETSMFLLGKVAVAVILPESTCNSEPTNKCEDWTDEEIANVKQEIISATNWWIAREPRAQLGFIYDWYLPNLDDTSDLVQVYYEPIDNQWYYQGFWMNEILHRMGFDVGSCFDNTRAFNNYLREKHGTDWAFTFYVVDSSRDTDNMFYDSTVFAYAYEGGPFAVITYGNDGYHIRNMDTVAAHEMGHIFHAQDQYLSAHKPCTGRSGYIFVENQNSQYNPYGGLCLTNDPSIMRGQVYPFQIGALDYYAHGQVGWWDQDQNGILDPIDTDLELMFNPIEETNGNFAYSGTVEEIPYPAPFYRDITINKINFVQYSFSDINGPWANANSSDEQFDSFEEGFDFSQPSSQTGSFYLRITDNFAIEKVFRCSCIPECSTGQTPLCEPFSEPIFPPEAYACIDSGFKWTLFGNTCVDSCEAERDPDTVKCGQMFTWGCDCGKDQCWNQQTTTCEPN